MEEAGGAAPDPDRSRDCAVCGWAGSEAAMREMGDPQLLACPRCGAGVPLGLPSIDEIRAARRTPADVPPPQSAQTEVG